MKTLRRTDDVRTLTDAQLAHYLHFARLELAGCIRASAISAELLKTTDPLALTFGAVEDAFVRADERYARADVIRAEAEAERRRTARQSIR